MKRIFFLTVLMLGFAQFALAISFGPYGDLNIRGQQKTPSEVVILLSDVSGWGAHEEALSKVLGDDNALVIGVDSARYFGNMTHPDYEPNISRDLEGMSRHVQKELGLSSLSTPLLLGMGGGATMVYANLVQAPPGTFRAGLSIGFHPELPLPRPFTNGRGLTWQTLSKGVRFDAVTRFELPWTILQAEKDPVFSEGMLRTFVQGMRGVQVQTLPGTGDYALEPVARAVAKWLADLHKADAAALAGRADVADLPLVELPAQGEKSDSLCVFVTGDGGWAGIDKDVAAILGKNGISVVGLDSLHYFWTKRTPQGGGEDLARIMRHYMAAWKMKRVILVGFSLGADALPPMAATLPKELRETIREITLLAPSKKVSLEFHLTDWVHDDEDNQDIALLPEVRKMEPIPLLCVYGADEESSLCHDLRADEATIKALPGTHHFNGDYTKVAEVILQHLKDKAP